MINRFSLDHQHGGAGYNPMDVGCSKFRYIKKQSKQLLNLETPTKKIDVSRQQKFILLLF